MRTLYFVTPNCIFQALADLSMGTKKKIVVPYRDSVLTKLLQNALGGNSKTIMIAALSPADINYDETLSTLRYADRAKKIKNKAVVNENPLDKLIRELKEENEKLRKAMEAGGVVQGSEGMTPEQIAQMKKKMEEEIRAQLMANQQVIADSAESWEQKLAAARSEHEAISGPSDSGRKSRDPHLINLNEDPMLSGVITHFLESGETTIGRKDASPKPTICLSGLSIEKKHAVITNSNGKIEISSSGSNSKTKVNGLPLQSKKELCHKDRIVFGSNHVYVFINPQKKETATDDLPDEITWEFVQKEIAKVKGFATGSAGLTKDQQIAQEQVLEILPMVSEVNAVSEELNKHKAFEVVLISAAAQEGGEIGGANTKNNKHALIATSVAHSNDVAHDFTSLKPTKYLEDECTVRYIVLQIILGYLINALCLFYYRVMVKMKNLLNGNTWLWERGKFMNRKYLIQDLYQKYLDGEDVSKIPKEQDPFWEPTEDVLIGTANVFLQTLLYALDFSDDIAITDYKGGEEGQITVHVTPCSQNGKPLDEDSFVDDPKELVGKPYHFQVTIQKAQINKARFSKGISVKYKVNLSSKSKDFIETPVVKNTLEPEFKHSKVISIPKLKAKHLQFFEHGCITFCVYGKQEDTLPDPKLLKLTTRELREMSMNQELRQMDTNLEQPITAARRGTIFQNDMASDQSHLKTELALLQRKYERLASKEKRMQQICDEWSNKDPSEQQYEPFFRAVSAVAHSTGTKLRTRVQLLNQVKLLLILHKLI
ncbi:hypothetical protein KUTeg_019179 [Tegillarca granosa]|uniref:Kinesin motor domain-containing protein n=1 Tax=Tegillarca granosa TaxID=220873 RepID=A0ABQ9EBT1_TEGGR|nr:hypothetical protein KUTeg_019179 [Tegillarca granosa]